MIVTCWSVKGGSGVSVVAAAMATLLAERHGSVALVDLGGDQPAVLGQPEPPGPGVLDWCASEAGPEALERVVVDVVDGVALLPRGDGPDSVAPARARDLLEGLGSLAPVVVVDAGAPLDAVPPDGEPRPDPDGPRPAGAWTRAAGSSLFVVRPCYLALRRAMRAGIDADGVVVVSEGGRALDAEDVSSVLGLPVVGVVQCDPAVMRAVDAGLLVRRLPGTLARGLRDAG